MTHDMRSLYQDLNMWVVDACDGFPHPTHADWGPCWGGLRICVRPDRALIAHMDNSMDYATLLS
jgi:phosphoribosyl 1,2-cyclic phosphate phosphodiesterase